MTIVPAGVFIAIGSGWVFGVLVAVVLPAEVALPLLCEDAGVRKSWRRALEEVGEVVWIGVLPKTILRMFNILCSV